MIEGYKPNIGRIDLTKEEGNTLFIVGKAALALRRSGLPDRAEELKNRIFKAGSPEEAYTIIEEYVTVRFIHDPRKKERKRRKKE